MCSGYATFYQSRIMPYFIHGGCSMRTFARMREKIIPKARGLVVEIGFGSGLNLPYYDPAKVSRLSGIEPDPSMLSIARKRLGEFRMPIELIEGQIINGFGLRGRCRSHRIDDRRMGIWWESTDDYPGGLHFGVG